MNKALHIQSANCERAFLMDRGQLKTTDCATACAGDLREVEARLYEQVGSDWAMSALREAGVAISARDAVSIALSNPKIIGQLTRYAEGQRSLAGSIRAAFAQQPLFTAPVISAPDVPVKAGTSDSQHVASDLVFTLEDLMITPCAEGEGVLRVQTNRTDGYFLSISEAMMLYAVLIGGFKACRFVSERSGAVIALGVQQEHHHFSVQLGAKGTTADRYLASAKAGHSICNLILESLRRRDSRVASHEVLCGLVRRLAPAQVADHGLTQ